MDSAAPWDAPIAPVAPSHKRYKGVSAPVGDAFAAAQPVIENWRNGRPVDREELTSAFNGLAAQIGDSQTRANIGLDTRAPFEVVGINARLNWLSMAASRNGIELTSEQNGLAFGASLSLPVGENDFPFAGRLPQLGRQQTRYTITNVSAGEAAPSGPDLVPVGELQPTHGKTMSNKQLDKLIKNIRNEGIKQPLTVTEHQQRLYILDGHHRALAAPRAGLAEVPVRRVELPWGAYQTPDDLNFTFGGY
jgi:hypothetical protein